VPMVSSDICCCNRRGGNRRFHLVCVREGSRLKLRGASSGIVFVVVITELVIKVRCTISSFDLSGFSVFYFAMEYACRR
jgi:hypothetical protein